MRILALDPGRTTGICVLMIDDEKRPHPVYLNETRDMTLLEIENLFANCDVVVCEGFKIRPKKAHSGAFDWSDMETPQVIGAAKLLANQNKVPIVEQDASIKPMGYGWANLKYVKGKKGVHIQDAVAHAMYYAVRKQLCGPVDTKLLGS